MIRIKNNASIACTVAFLWLFSFEVRGISPRMNMEILRIESCPGQYGAEQIRYEKLIGRISGEIDPFHPLNALITDISLAPRNANGMVEYTSDFFLIKPVDLSKSNGVLQYDAPNRGNAFGTHPDSVLMARGYIFLSAAWQGDVEKRPTSGRYDRLYLETPVARNPDGSRIIGLVRAEFVPEPHTHPFEMPLCGNVYNAGHLSYTPVAFPGNNGCVLTRRIRESDPRRLIPNSEWAFAATGGNNPFPGVPDSTKISLNGGFDSDYLYELVYQAKDPKVMGVGLAAIRDIVCFFRDERQDAGGNPNPVYGFIRYCFGTGTSQSGNLMKTFLHLGFNESLKGGKVFDALFPVVASRQTNINMRFANPGGGGGVRAEHCAPGQSSVKAFPADYTDALSGEKGGLFARSEKSATLPKVFLLLTASELWMLQASLVLTDAYGQYDLIQPGNLRIYYLAGAQHSVGISGQMDWDPSRTLYPGSSGVNGNAVLRALRISLEEWVIRGFDPPPSEIPSVSAQTLVFPEELRYPAMKGLSLQTDGGKKEIPPFKYRGIVNQLSILELGSDFSEHDESGVATQIPPAVLPGNYAVMVSRIDADGNETGGLRTVDLLAPLGTSLGYNYDSRQYLEDFAGLNGSFIPFHITRKSRVLSGDSRLSLEERYGNHEGYVKRVRQAAESLVNQRFLLREDADRMIRQAIRTNPFITK